MNRQILLLIFIFLGPGALAAQSSAVASSQAASSVMLQSSPQDQQQSASATSRIEVLQAQLQTMKEYHSSLVDTVYWAMGGVFLIAGTLVGFGWFANFKVYERDKASLKADLEAHQKERLAELESAAARNAASIEASLMKKLEILLTEHQTKLNDKVGSLESASRSNFDSLERSLTALKVTVLDKSMRQHDNPTSAITDAVSLLELCAAKAPHNIDRTLAFFLDQLNKGGKLLVSKISRVNAVLTKLPVEHKAYVDRIGPKLLDSKML